MQKGDRPVLDKLLGNFGALNEPHYEDYITTDIGALFEAGGLTCDTKYVASSTKTLSFRKPAAEATAVDEEAAEEADEEAAVEEAAVEEAVEAAVEEQDVPSDAEVVE